ncbi:MAG TPA: signal peptidase II [Anaerolineae bacterium]|nr:signal peptidase II [Anaerolineae bacterium]HOR01291.1 signal peptidase II [Anaerolineae bacterium]HPL30688.1 signal peptidase II [Anaerolineae bacterium]
MSFLRTKWRGVLVFAVAATALLADQLTKAAVMRHLTPLVPWNPVAALSPYFSLTYVTNTGAAFGLFPQLSGVYPFITLTIVVGLLVFCRRFGIDHWLLHVCLGLQLGGALGNLVDRLTLGHVVDFLDFKFWPVFNVADSCIVVGVCILAFLLLRASPAEEAKPAEPDGAPGPA